MHQIIASIHSSEWRVSPHVNQRKPHTQYETERCDLLLNLPFLWNLWWLRPHRTQWGGALRFRVRSRPERMGWCGASQPGREHHSCSRSPCCWWWSSHPVSVGIIGHNLIIISVYITTKYIHETQCQLMSTKTSEALNVEWDFKLFIKKKKNIFRIDLNRCLPLDRVLWGGLCLGNWHWSCA